MAAPLVLTIEDQADIRRLIRMTLEIKGLRVEEAENGERGLELARRLRPDLILLDVMMPGIDGLTVARTLAEDGPLAAVPIVMLSALCTAADVGKGLSTGVRSYLSKPFSPWDLLAEVERLLAERAAEAGT